MLRARFNLHNRNIYWGDIADWIARHDCRVPVYHQLCIAAWSWCLGRSLQNPRYTR